MAHATKNRRAPTSSVLAIRLGALVAVLCLVGYAWYSSLPATRPAELQAVSLHVPEMNCDVWCPIQIDNALRDVRGVFDLEVEVSRGEVRANIDPAHVQASDLEKLLRERGWKVETASTKENQSELP
ncbi:MAG: copper chaperone CopZ [Planctomycetota bacterium]|jgi:copper chaperone CopZ